jgi:tetratricopeptide (TPR) repeat protein
MQVVLLDAQPQTILVIHTMLNNLGHPNHLGGHALCRRLSGKTSTHWTMKLTLEMVRKATIACFLSLMAVCVPRGTIAQEAKSADLFNDDQARGEVRGDQPTSEVGSLDLLSRKKYSRRQAATLEMWRKRDLSRDQVQEAARHPDPEVSGRAKWILRQWRRGSLPDTPPEISRLLQRTDGPLAIERLLEGGQFTAVIVAVEESAGTIDREAIQKRIASAMLRRFPIFVHHAIRSDSLPELLKLIDLTADSKEMAICRIQLMRQLGTEFEANTLLPASAVTWPPIKRQRATVLALITLGKTDEAIRIASESVDKDLLHQCRMIAARWSEAAHDNLLLAREAEEGSYEHARLWCLTLIAADRAGDQSMFDEAVLELSSSEASEDDLASELRWKCLASHGKVDAAFAILDAVSPDASASVSMDASRTGRAFVALGFPLDRVDSEVDQWVDSAIEAQRHSNATDLVEEVRKILALMQCLISIGRDDAAWSIADRLSRSDVNVSSLRLREFVLSTLTMTKRTDWVVRLAVRPEEKTLSQTSQNTIARTLSDADAISLDIVMQAFAQMMVGQPLTKRLRAAHQLLEGEIPEGFDRDEDFRRLYEYVTRPRPIRQLRGRELGRKGILANLGVVNLFARHGESDLASACLKKLAQSGDLKALFYLAEQELDGGRAEIALGLFESVFKTVVDQGRATGRFGSADDTALAVKAMIGSWTIARRNGHEQLSAELERELRLILCSPSTRLRNTIAGYLGERGDAMLAMEIYEVLLPMTVLGNQEQTGLYDVARSYSVLARKTNAAEAARWFDLAVGGTLDSMNFRPGAYITLPLYVRRWLIESAIGRKDADDVQRHLDRILALDPLDIDFAERLLPEMRKAGMDELADKALDKIMDHGVEYAEAFPFDAMSSNNLAWVAAMNRKRLDDALRLSELAVFVEPDSAIYRDTLAEVLFLLDRKEEALQVEQGCLLDDPTQWHLHQQIEKYSEAIESDDT